MLEWVGPSIPSPVQNKTVSSMKMPTSPTVPFELLKGKEVFK
jgi:hypothetical protein